MRVHFKSPVIFNKHHYMAGAHEVPDSLAGHWHFLALVANGKAKVLKGPKKPVMVDAEDGPGKVDGLAEAQDLAPKPPEKVDAPVVDPLAKAVIDGKKQRSRAAKAAKKAAQDKA